MAAQRENPFPLEHHPRTGGWSALKSALAITDQRGLVADSHDAPRAPGLRLVLDNLACSVTLVDRDYRIWLANPAAASFLHLPPRQAEGRSCFTAFRCASGPCHAGPDCPVNNVVQSNRPFRTVVSHLDRRSKPRFVEISASPLVDEPECVALVVLLHRDVTELEIAKQQLKTSTALAPSSGTVSNTLWWSGQTGVIPPAIAVDQGRAGIHRPPVSELSNAANSPLDANVAAGLLLERVGSLVDAQCRVIIQIGAPNRAPSIYRAQGDCARTEGFLEGFGSVDDIPLLSEALEGTVFVRDLWQAPALLPLASDYSPPTSLAATPLRSNGVVLGILVAIGPPGQAIALHQVESLELACAEVASWVSIGSR